MSDRKLLPSVQALRGIAACLVVYHHFSNIFQGPNSQSWIYSSGLGPLGRCGVDIFFVISGFIMLYTTVGKFGPADALTFLKRRVLRIYPLYWVWTTALLALWVSGLARLEHQFFSIPYMFKSYLLVPAFNGYYFHPFLGQGWTLSFEMLFYLVFSCSIMLGFRRSKLLFLAIAFSLLACVGLLFPGSGAAFLLSNTVVVEFLYGALAATLLLHAEKRRIQFGKVLPASLMLSGTALLLLALKLQDVPDSVRFVFFGIPAFLIICGAVMLEDTPAPRLLSYLGDSSYSIYLAHIFFALVFAHTLKHSAFLQRFPADAEIIVVGTVAIALSSFSYPLVERPLARFLSRKSSSGPEASVAAIEHTVAL